MPFNRAITIFYESIHLAVELLNLSRYFRPTLYKTIKSISFIINKALICKKRIYGFSKRIADFRNSVWRVVTQAKYVLQFL